MTVDDPKAGNKIRNIWYGENFTRCDGNIMGFSNMTSILLTSPKRASDLTPFMEIVSGGWSALISDVDYTHQFVYRKMAVSQYYLKETFFAFVMILMFRQVSTSYQDLFKGPFKYVSFTDGQWVFTESSGMYDFDRIEP